MKKLIFLAMFCIAQISNAQIYYFQSWEYDTDDYMDPYEEPIKVKIIDSVLQVVSAIDDEAIIDSFILNEDSHRLLNNLDGGWIDKYFNPATDRIWELQFDNQKNILILRDTGYDQKFRFYL